MIDHLGDLESDLSRFHRVDDIWDMDGPRFFRLAYRVSAYGGVIAMLTEQQQQSQPPAPVHHAPPRAVAEPGEPEVSLSQLMVMDPTLADLERVVA